MEYMRLLLIAALFVLEQLLFAHVILNKTIILYGVRRKAVLIAALLGETAVVLMTKSLDCVLGASYLFSGILFFAFYETKLLSWLRDYLCTVFAVTFLEIGFLFIYTKLGISSGETVTVCYSVTILVLLSIVWWLAKGKHRDIGRWSSKIWVPFLAFLGESCILFSLYTFLYSAKQYSIFSIQVLVVFGFGIGVLSVVWLLLYLIHAMQHIKAENEELEKYSLEQRNYFLQLLQREEETKKFRHDILNHILQLQSYQSKEMYAELEVYLEQLLQNVQNLKGKKFSTGNDIIDVILNYYLLNMKECRVCVEGLVADDLPVAQTELCSIAANLVKNAAEAAEKTRNPQIHIVFVQGKHFFKMQVENTYDKKLKRNKKGDLLTTKRDKSRHGYGTEIIKGIVKKYHGEYEMKISEERISVCVILEISQSADTSVCVDSDK